jgi:gamma-glutamylcyclotransferase (GGCT)/AIG2-like uncharacterized protein YtfP
LARGALVNRPRFEVFVYGTLKRGQRNHAYCHGAARVRGAKVRGALYDLAEGYPALVVPEQDVLAVGSADHLRDVAEVGYGSRPVEIPALERPTVFGELYTFDDPEERLPDLDLLEEFVPGNPASPYRRVLIPALTEDGTVVLAWSYAARHPGGKHLPEGRWPGPTS